MRTTKKPPTIDVPFKNAEEGNKFRNWVNDTYADYAKSINLDRKGSHNNSYIAKAWGKYGKEYQKQQSFGKTMDKIKSTDPMDFMKDELTQQSDTFSHVGSDIKKMAETMSFTPSEQDEKILNTVKEKTKTDEGVFSFIRKRVPNIVQFFKAKNLGDNDFTDNQKKVIYDAIKSSINRGRNEKMGSTKYADYGDEVASKFKNKKGSPSDWDVVWGAVTADDKFAMATLLGRFSWKKNNDGSYKVTDKYDFKHPGYNAITGINRKQLEGKSVMELKNEYGLGNYEAARVKAWVDHPDNIPSKALSVEITINPDEFA